MINSRSWLKRETLRDGAIKISFVHDIAPPGDADCLSSSVRQCVLFTASAFPGTVPSRLRGLLRMLVPVQRKLISEIYYLVTLATDRFDMAFMRNPRSCN